MSHILSVSYHSVLRVLRHLAVESRGGAAVSHHGGVVLAQKHRLRQMFSEIGKIFLNFLNKEKIISPLMVLTSSFRVSVMSSLQADV